MMWLQLRTLYLYHFLFNFRLCFASAVVEKNFTEEEEKIHFPSIENTYKIEGPGPDNWPFRSSGLSRSLQGAPNMCTCETYANVALAGTAFSSPSYADGLGISGPERAIDGLTYSKYENLSCSITISSVDSWWYVQLEDTYDIALVRIYNRSDENCPGSCGDLLEDFSVYLMADDITVEEIKFSSKADSYEDFVFTGRGNRVKIKKHDEGVVQLCEVEVYARSTCSPDTDESCKCFSPLTNIAEGRNGRISSRNKSLGQPKHTTDGNVYSALDTGSCAQTKTENNPWLSINLGPTHTIGMIRIFNRSDLIGCATSPCADLLHDVYVSVLDNNDDKVHTQFHAGTVQSHADFFFPMTQGRRIMVEMDGSNEVLTICEIQVYEGKCMMLSEEPSVSPSNIPSPNPSSVPSNIPSISSAPSKPPSFEPSKVPSTRPSEIPSKRPSDSPSDVASFGPSNFPSNVPSFIPSDIPSDIPSLSPSGLPSPNPSDIPSDLPSNLPSDLPSFGPSDSPSDAPSYFPSDTPTVLPSYVPSDLPTFHPSENPSEEPSDLPSHTPSFIPSNIPSNTPSISPSNLPSIAPSGTPSNVPSDLPSDIPSSIPSDSPSDVPSVAPSGIPSNSPSDLPSHVPSFVPSDKPSYLPTYAPSDVPSHIPSDSPSYFPSSSPSDEPSTLPSGHPSTIPSSIPSSIPSLSPSFVPSSSHKPSPFPIYTQSVRFTLSFEFSGDNYDFALNSTEIEALENTTLNFLNGVLSDSAIFVDTLELALQSFITFSIDSDDDRRRGLVDEVSKYTNLATTFIAFGTTPEYLELDDIITDTISASSSKYVSSLQDDENLSIFLDLDDIKVLVVEEPSVPPTSQPSVSVVPSYMPSEVPTSTPSDVPSDIPSTIPSNAPTSIPSDGPSSIPSVLPSSSPSSKPSDMPSSLPSSFPTDQPSVVPSFAPYELPSALPSELPSSDSSSQPSDIQSALPSTLLRSFPSELPSSDPSSQPSDMTSTLPSFLPGNNPSQVPSELPSSMPSYSPITALSEIPSDEPSLVPSFNPSSILSSIPSHFPSNDPSNGPLYLPSRFPNQGPTSIPNIIPSHIPISNPSISPTSIPTHVPSKFPTLTPITVSSDLPSVSPTISTGPSPFPVVAQLARFTISFDGLANLNSVLNETESAALINVTFLLLNEYAVDSTITFDSLKLIKQSFRSDGGIIGRRLQSGSTSLATTYIALGTCPSNVDLSDISSSVLNENIASYIAQLKADPILGVSAFAGNNVGLELVAEPSVAPSMHPSISKEPSAAPTDLPSYPNLVTTLSPNAPTSVVASSQTPSVSVSGNNAVPSSVVTDAPSILSPIYTYSPNNVDESQAPSFKVSGGNSVPSASNPITGPSTGSSQAPSVAASVNNAAPSITASGAPFSGGIGGPSVPITNAPNLGPSSGSSQAPSATASGYNTTPSPTATNAPATVSPSYTSPPSSDSESINAPSSTNLPTTVDQTPSVISPTNQSPSILSSGSPTSIVGAPSNAGVDDDSPSADMSVAETILQIIAVGTPGRIMDATEANGFAETVKDHLNDKVQDSSITYRRVIIVSQQLSPPSDSSRMMTRSLANDDSLYVTMQIFAVCPEAVPLYAMSKSLFESTASEFMIVLKAHNVLGSGDAAYFNSVGDVILGESPSQSPTEGYTDSEEPTDEATEGVSQSTLAGVGAAAAAGSAAAAAAAAGGGGGGDSGGGGESSNNNTTENQTAAKTDAEAEARKQMMGRNNKKNTGRAIAKGKKDAARLKQKILNKKADQLKDYDAQRDFRIRCTVLVAVRKLDNHRGFVRNYVKTNHTGRNFLSDDARELLEIAVDQLAHVSV